MQQPVGIWDALRAYYVGHVGKYVPGKAMVLVIRGSLVKDAGVNPLLAGLTAAYETLVFMATGTMLALAIAPFSMRESVNQQMPEFMRWIGDHPSAVSLLVAGLTFASTPISAWLFTKLGLKTLPKTEFETSMSPSISAALISLGVVVSSLSWTFHTISLGCVIQSISDAPFDLTEFPRWMLCCTASTVGGFVILIAPGGLGVREGILIELLKNQPEITAAGAVVVAGLLRAVWFISEMVGALMFYVAKPSRLTKERKTGE
jgi:glycosyltransferase 2 family protein